MQTALSLFQDLEISREDLFLQVVSWKERLCEIMHRWTRSGGALVMHRQGGFAAGMGFLVSAVLSPSKRGRYVSLAVALPTLAFSWLLSREGKIIHQIPGKPGWYGKIEFWRELFSHTLRSLTSSHWKVRVDNALRYEQDLRHHLRRELKISSFQAPCHKSEIHGHPKAAGLRRGVHVEIVKQLRAKGFKPYDISSSRRSQALGTDGYHGWFTDRDLNYPEMNNPVDVNSVFVMIDVDYYLDIHTMASQCLPMVMWTCDPVEPSGKTDEELWVFEDGKLTYQVSGGGKYEHGLWDYGTADYCTFLKGVNYYTYAKEEVRVEGTQHKLLILTPVSVGLWSSSHMVTRRVRSDGVSRHFAEVVINDGTQEYRLTSALYDTILRRLELCTNTQLYSIQQFLDSAKDQVLKGDKMCLAAWIASNKPKLLKTRALTWASWVRRGGKDIANDMKARTMEVVPPPSNVTAMAPTNAPVSVAAAVVHRVQDVKNNVKPPKEVFNRMEEFITAFFADVGLAEHSLEPLSVEEVQVQTHNAKTVARMARVISDPFFDVATDEPVEVKAFSKSETYVGKAKERVISPVDDVNLTVLARFTYALKPFLKRTSWYCPGKTPLQIAEAVTEFTRNHNSVSETDYSNFDGTINRWLRHLERRLYVRAFSGIHAKQVGAAIKREIDVEFAKSRAGTYKPDGIRLSGSGLTTDGNTILNAFVQYLARRKQGENSLSAYGGIGLCFGDDGVMDGVFKENMAQTCKELGLVIKMVDACTPDRPYVTFLGRVFPSRDSTYSFQEPLRVWPKIHLITRSNPSDESKRHASKVGAFVILDKHSPLLGKYAMKLLSLHPHGAEVLANLCPESKIADLTGNWMYQESQATASNSWPQDEMSAAATYDLYCQLLGITREQADQAEQRIDGATKLEELKNIFELPVPQLPSHIAVDGDTFTTGSPLKMRNRVNKETPCAKNKGSGKAPTGSGARVKNNRGIENARQKSSSKAQGPATSKIWRRSGSPGS